MQFPPFAFLFLVAVLGLLLHLTLSADGNETSSEANTKNSHASASIRRRKTGVRQNGDSDEKCSKSSVLPPVSDKKVKNGPSTAAGGTGPPLIRTLTMLALTLGSQPMANASRTLGAGKEVLPMHNVAAAPWAPPQAQPPNQMVPPPKNKMERSRTNNNGNGFVKEVNVLTDAQVYKHNYVPEIPGEVFPQQSVDFGDYNNQPESNNGCC
ncbi:hypothetical protein niasHS_016427 [Heterodera schachtii]|uniref:Uncharacterized protein n=1 Tax=Heterodera schachtii TaxID=97005 RepID=A0ABD2HPQ1_HETSC